MHCFTAGYEQRQKARDDKQNERTRSRSAGAYKPKVWDAQREEDHQKNRREKRKANRKLTQMGTDVSIQSDQSCGHLTHLSQQTLPKLDPRNFIDDLVLALLQKGKPLTIIDAIRPVLRAHTGMSFF